MEAERYITIAQISYSVTN